MWLPWVWEQGQRDGQTLDGPALARIGIAVVILIGCAIAYRYLTRRR